MLGRLLDRINEQVTVKGGRGRETRVPGDPSSHSHICQLAVSPCRQAHTLMLTHHSPTADYHWLDWGKASIQAEGGSLLWEFGVKGSKVQPRRRRVWGWIITRVVSVVPGSACPLEKAAERASLPWKKSEELTTERNTDQEIGRTFSGVWPNYWFL